MPVIESNYAPPPFLSGGHVQTLFSSLFRWVDFRYDRRERIGTPDGDFLELHWADPQPRRTSEATDERVAVLTHGLEGSADRPYMRGMARALVRRGWTVCAWNLRGCGKTMNQRPITYHSGKTEDLAAVVNHVQARCKGDTSLIGFSLGGNLTLKYLGERGPAVADRIRGAVVISVPVDLEAASYQIAHWSNRHYTTYFLRSLREKIQTKATQHPGVVRTDALPYIGTLRDFDDAYTAPLNGFRTADTYYRRASSKPVLGNIAVPTLLLNAANDPFLPAPCYPRTIAQEHDALVLEVPESGGHVGFVTQRGDEYWSERRAASFLATRPAGGSVSRGPRRSTSREGAPRSRW
ncbi:MAG: YheT family hydrolase [Salinivenus sp.]